MDINPRHLKAVLRSSRRRPRSSRIFWPPQSHRWWTPLDPAYEEQTLEEELTTLLEATSLDDYVEHLQKEKVQLEGRVKSLVESALGKHRGEFLLGSPGFWSSSTLAEALNLSKRPTTTKFRLLDLPAEIRNRIYEYTSDSACEAPFLMARMPSDRQRPTPASSELGFWRRRVLSYSHASRIRDIDRRHPFALLCTCKKVYAEASSMYYEKMEVDLRTMYLPTSLGSMIHFMHIFDLKIQFIRHVEVNSNMALWMLFDANRTTHFKTRVGMDAVYGRSILPRKTVDRLRLRLFSLRSITIYPTVEGHEAICKRLIPPLAEPNTRTRSHRRFPFLNDIMLINKYGGERFRRRQDNSWESWYSGARMPLSVNPGEDLSLRLKAGEYDTTTGLSGATTLSSIGPPVPQGVVATKGAT